MATSPRGTKAGRPKARSKTLRQAASLVFAVTAILPLLLFVWTVYYLGALSRLSAQVGLGVALATSLMGYYVFRGLIGQMSDLIAVIGKVLERSPAGPRASAEPLEETSAESAGGWAAPSSVPAAPPRLRRSAEPASPAHAERPDTMAASDAPAHLRPSHPPARGPASEPARRPSDVHTVPGFGAIREVHDLRRATALLWQAEAAAYKGRRVVVSVMNSPRPITGMLTELTEEGLLIQLEGSERVVAAYNRISAIDAEDSPA
ncbi:MAG: hypothetical protein DME15_05600 [Candidatus Rokuibacteriota bacterium]|nr:MAG: hypothetical protein DME15_05600 [Candidatus Rokubacteria bacterium]